MGSPTDMGGDSNESAPDAQGDGASDAGEVDTDNMDPGTSSCDFGEQGRAPYTIFHADGRKLLIGDVDSVASESAVQVLNSTGASIAETQAAQNGSFALQSQESLPGTIVVRSTLESSTDLSVGLTDATTAAYAGSQQMVEAWAGTDFADGSGFRLEQAGDTLELNAASQTLLPGLSVVLANLSQGMAMVEKVNNDGSFSVWVQAESGDAIVIFTVEHGSSNGGGQPLTIEAP